MRHVSSMELLSQQLKTRRSMVCKIGIRDTKSMTKVIALFYKNWLSYIATEESNVEPYMHVPAAETTYLSAICLYKFSYEK